VTRRAEATYELPYLGSPSTGGGCFSLGVASNDCPTFLTTPKENWVRMEVEDAASPTPVAFSIFQSNDQDPSTLESTIMGGPFCGSSGKEPVRIAPGVEVGVFVYASGDFVCPGAFATSGTVKAVFSNLP
ncbi:MAG: hypothetical protein ACRDKT_02820, partial [Actinomycetota bacterium]